MGKYSYDDLKNKMPHGMFRNTCFGALLLLMPVIMAGCSDLENFKGYHSAQVSNEIEATITQTPKEEIKKVTPKVSDKDKKPTVTVKPKITDTPKTTNRPTSVKAKQPEKRDVDSGKFTFDQFASLDNSKLGWWYKINDDKTRSVSTNISTLLKKYDGIYLGDTTKKVLYLTFDEGYENGYTPKILDVLKENDVKAAFFITGAYLKSQPELVKRMLDDGHQVGNHTVNHPSMPSVSSEVLEKEILDLEKKFEEKFSKGMKYLRPPSGEYSEKTLAISKALGYKTVFWSFHYLDYDVKNQKGTDFAYNTVMNGLHKGAVMLLHAVSKDNTAALDRIIKDARAQGYEFKLLE